MRRWLPFPLLTAALVAMWLLLTESVSLGSILMGGVLALLTVQGFARLDPPRGRLRRTIVVSTCIRSCARRRVCATRWG